RAKVEESERLKEMERELKARELDSLEDVLNAPDESELEARQATIDEYYQKKQRIATILEGLQKEVKDKEQPDLESLEKSAREFQESLKKAEEELEKARGEISEQEKRRQNYDDLIHRRQKTEEKNRPLFELANDLTGRNARNINFETFVLNHYLRTVTMHANHRLLNLSDGRYELIVSSDIEHGNRQTGLNLDIMDSHTGIPRSVKSLSGGEKFLASLSLALGLADAIQERAGRIEMDSLFLDEGFGTLDSEALNRAMGILEEIRENRMVGIISHVDELKRTVPCQVRLVRTRKGSKITVHRGETP
ncbi:MAG: hypothetical protein KDK25_14550, partial [Leptospiraceae bacterium]|nr:hypothetical protein [Leptospiraceae bacterium]